MTNYVRISWYMTSKSREQWCNAISLFGKQITFTDDIIYVDTRLPRSPYV